MQHCQALKSPILIIQWILECCMSSLSSHLGSLLRSQIDSLGKILPNSGQNYQIHVTDDRHIVLMRNLLPPPVLFRYLCRISVRISPCFPFTVHSLTHPLTARYLKRQKILSSNHWKCDLKSWNSGGPILHLSLWLIGLRCTSVQKWDWFGKVGTALISTLLNSFDCVLDGRMR